MIKDNLFQDPYINRHDFTVGGFNTNPGGELELGVSYLDKPDSDDAHSGWSRLSSSESVRAGRLTMEMRNLELVTHFWMQRFLYDPSQVERSILVAEE